MTSELRPAELAALSEALALAENAIGLSDPNPRVGCIVLSPSGETLATGHTQQAGSHHAEVMALMQARERGLDLKSCTAVVTLEPCSHFGRTPPCCNALIEAGIARVVVAVEDPNPLVSGRGMALLREAGIEVIRGPEALARQAEELNVGFFSRMRRGRPFVRMKLAASLDGRTALPDGRSQWITGPEARTDGHAYRRRAGAVLTGLGTVQHDDPRLDVRLVNTVLQPLRVVVDSRLRIPAASRILRPPGQVLLVHAGAEPRSDCAEVEQLAMPDGRGRVDLAGLVQELGRRGVNELHVEAGQVLNGALLAAGLVDELLLYQAPLLIGDGLGLAALPPLGDLSEAPRWRRVDCTPLGADLRLRFRPD